MKAKLAASEENVKDVTKCNNACIYTHEGRIPPELGAMFGNTTNPRVIILLKFISYINVIN